MRVFIAGVDGYLGWALALYLAQRGHEISGADAYLRRDWVDEMGSQSAIPISSMQARLEAFKEKFGKELRFYEGDLSEYDFVEKIFEETMPEAIVHLGQMPSAQYSMMDVKHAVWTQVNNISSNLNFLFAMKDVCPEAHLIKLGTMGEYGTPNIDIPEGFFEIEFRGRKDRLPFPRQAGSWYHQSKVHDSNNVMLGCKLWDLKSTDIMQGVVFGTHIEEMEGDPRLLTRLDFDQCFGTAINRFCCQATIGHSISLYGTGGQKRGFLPLRDSMQCLKIAIENPPKNENYRVFNQFEEVYNIHELAEKVKRVGDKSGLEVEIRHLENPRVEMEEHYFNPDHQNLLDLGYEPTHDVEKEIEIMFKDLMLYKDRIEEKKGALLPDITWAGERKKSNYIV